MNTHVEWTDDEIEVMARQADCTPRQIRMAIAVSRLCDEEVEMAVINGTKTPADVLSLN